MFTGTQVAENLDGIVRYLEALPDSELLPPLGKYPLAISKVVRELRTLRTCISYRQEKRKRQGRLDGWLAPQLARTGSVTGNIEEQPIA